MGKTCIREKKITRDKKTLVSNKRISLQENITILNVHTSNNRSASIKQKMIEMEGEMDKSHNYSLVFQHATFSNL